MSKATILAAFCLLNLLSLHPALPWMRALRELQDKAEDSVSVMAQDSPTTRSMRVSRELQGKAEDSVMAPESPTTRSATTEEEDETPSLPEESIVATKEKETPSVLNISLNTTRRGGMIDVNMVLCQELLNRTNGAKEGQEPWRQNGQTVVVTTQECKGQGSSILGNHLSRWYVARLIAAAAGVTIVGSCDSDVTRQIQQDVSPESTPIPASFSWRALCERCLNKGKPSTCVYPHSDLQNGSLEAALPTIRSDLGAMAQRVVQTHPDLELDQVALHIRTGDIARQKNKQYGLVPYQSYASLIPASATTIGIVTAPFDQKRKAWGHGDATLNEAVVVATRNYIQKQFPQARVTIRNDEAETMDVVFTRLIVANTTICGPSTYCLFPTLAGNHEAYILQSPLFGAEQSWLAQVEQTHPEIHYVGQPYISSNQLYKLSVPEILNALEASSATS